jgi:transposase
MCAKKTGSFEDLAVVGVDIGKDTFHLVGFDRGGQLVIPGIGPMISTAMVAAAGKGEAFDRGRDLAAWVGLVPTQYSTGGRTILGRITKRGSRYLRMLFVQAAKVIMMRQNRWSTVSFGPWLTEAVARMPPTKAAVALANKLARTAWSVLRHGTRFDAPGDMAMETI